MWDVGLAKMFKERNPKDLIGPCIGKVVSPNPLKISILSGDVILQGEQLYISRSLLDREYDCDVSGSGPMGEVINVGGTLNSLNLTRDSHGGKTKLYFELKVNDEVLLIPTENEQVYFIVDIVEKVGG